MLVLHMELVGLFQAQPPTSGSFPAYWWTIDFCSFAVGSA